MEGEIYSSDSAEHLNVAELTGEKGAIAFYTKDLRHNFSYTRPMQWAKLILDLKKKKGETVISMDSQLRERENLIEFTYSPCLNAWGKRWMEKGKVFFFWRRRLLTCCWKPAMEWSKIAAFPLRGTPMILFTLFKQILNYYWHCLINNELYLSISYCFLILLPV